MTYLGLPRIYFSGRFYADVPTLNNDLNNFAPAPSPAQQPPPDFNPNGTFNFNPMGTNNFGFAECQVTALSYRDGSFCTSGDPIIGLDISGSQTQSSAKIVDLDPAQRRVSEIWGLQLCLHFLSQPNAFAADFAPTPFSDGWMRIPGEESPSALYQGELSHIRWSEQLTSPLLLELKALGLQRLSLRFVLDSYQRDASQPDFGTGRLTGVIGPLYEQEPGGFVPGRLLRRQCAPQQYLLSGSPMFFAPCQLDSLRKTISLDLANSMPMGRWQAPEDIGELWLAALPAHSDQPLYLARIDYQHPEWYSHHSGIHDYGLDEEQLRLLAHTPLGIVARGPSNEHYVYLREDPSGLYIRAQKFVYRLNPGQSECLELLVTRFGRPAANQRVALRLNPDLINRVQIPHNPTKWSIGTPESALQFDSMVKYTNEQGQVSFTMRAASPGYPRKFVDRQIYAIGYQLEETQEALENPGDFISVLVWDEHSYSEPVTWEKDIRPVFEQYARLYPVMGRILRLDSYDELSKHLPLLRLVFSLPPTDPNYMPVSRDLSASKLAMIRSWLSHPLK